MKLDRVIISGGGTGGHIFPAIAVADEIKKRFPTCHILFVGAEGKMEMERVPRAGYKIRGLPIQGFQRKLTLANLKLPFKILFSLLKARRIIKQFKPQLVIGFGGYASGPTLKMANLLGVPTLIQEQNSFPGKTNKLLAKKAKAICTAYPNMELFFPKDLIRYTGNPIRSDIVEISGKRQQAVEHFNLDPKKAIILVIGGSLGARTLNKAIKEGMEKIHESNVQVIWQCGRLYHSDLAISVNRRNLTSVHLLQFIDRMDLAYAAADIVISRAGAISVSELSLVGKPTILVPSPNVAEDHQTKNALSLVNESAAILIEDNSARSKLVSEALRLITNESLKKELGDNILKFGKINATKEIVDVCISIEKRKWK
ncbi:MAG: undecaprenyldiphospho-muramoylpentapeptide beta-N-acetylglucosaminyltransferase [Bacteroidetes bacterium]|nr:undecaprenyldiphospho-muramoylpentapeptide beta-N-acetylglucosaminyltransferase [Bacteroidota bacterium]